MKKIFDRRGENGGKESLYSMFRFLMAHLDAEDRRGWRILMALSLVSPLMDIFSLSSVVYIINQAIRSGRAEPRLILFALAMVAVSIVKCLYELYMSKLTQRSVYNSAQKLSMKAYELLIKEDLRSHQQSDAMQAVTIVRQDTISCVQIIVSSINVWSSALTTVGYAAVLIYVSRLFGVASSILLMLLMAGEYLWTRERIKTYGEKSREYSIQANAQITIAYGSFKELKIDDRSDFVLEKYGRASKGYAQMQSKYHFESNSVVVCLRNAVMGVIFLIIAVILTAGSDLPVILTPIAAYITALTRMLPTAYSILSGLHNIEFARKPFDKLREMTGRYAAVKAEEQAASALRRKTPTFQRGISIRNLTFGYSEQVKIFEDASLDIPAGGSIAIIGVSGAGKTTLLDLILGLLKPQAGHIFFDDYDIVTRTDGGGPCQASLGDLVSYIPQTIYLNGETVRRNVAFFSEDAAIDDARVEECLRCAQIWEDVQRMPAGVHTLIGENGTAISGGQRQRIALARALYKDFELLVMDEATAALDMETERAVIDSIRQIRSGKTLLMVTHHMSLASECDVIYKIEDRKIVRVEDPARLREEIHGNT